jgi:Zn-dependent protease with chaperone function
MAFGRATAGLAALALVAAAPPAPPAVAPTTAAALQALVAKDLRVATISYRLQTAAVDHCPNKTRLAGLVVQDASQYRADLRTGMAALYGMTDLPTVTAVVPDGAGAAAGVTPGDSIVTVDGASLAAELPDVRGRGADGARFTAMIDRLDAAFAAGPVTLVLRHGDAVRTVTVVGAPACRSATQLDLSPARNASADGHTVSITQGIADFARSDDELAFVIGHELSHNILGHRDFLDSTHTARGLFAGLGGNGARLRDTERQADYLGVYLLAWAGYDPHAAASFWRRMDHADPLGSLLSDGTHPGNGVRVRALERAAAEIDAARAAGRPVSPDYQRFEATG